jgi:Xaa-Pro dipeptidase
MTVEGPLTAGSAREVDEKLRCVRAYLEQHELGGLLLGTLANFAWLTGGGSNRVGMATDVGGASLLVTLDGCYLVTDEIEAPRLLEEELTGLDIRPLVYPWHQPDLLGRVKEVTGGHVASDWSVPGMVSLPGEFAVVRWSLTGEEVERYRWVGKHAGIAMTHALFHLRPGLTEQQLAAMLAEVLLGFGLQPTALLVAADERIARYRHPLPTERRLERAALLVVGARRWGLTASLTRLVHFGEPDAELRRRHAAVTAIDAVFIRGTRSGAVVGDVVRAGIEAYAAHGFPNEWRQLHQGGPTGYVGREFRAMPETRHLVRDRQAFAWNPSIAGTKSEDTILVSTAGSEVLTQTPDLPQVQIGDLFRPDILIR